MATRLPKTPPSKHRLNHAGWAYDPDTTPTNHRIKRERSWEEQLEPISALADPRSLNSLAFNEIWRGEFVEASKVAFESFHNTLQSQFLEREEDYKRMRKALKRKDKQGFNDLNEILRVASLLFAGHPDLAHGLNECIPPGYFLDAAEDYVIVTTPTAKWIQYPDGLMVPIREIPSSAQ